MKKCNICNLEKDLSLFYKNILFKDGYFKYCKKCHKDKSTKREKEKLRLKDEKINFLENEFFIEHLETGLLCSNYGRIYYNGTKRHKHFLKQTKMKNGYITVSFNKKHLYVHRLIAEALIHNPDSKKYKYVNHLDCNKQNNNYLNLEWCTYSENIKHAIINDRYSVKLNREQVFDIRSLKDKKTPKELALMFNVSDVNIRLILNNKTWKHI